MNHITTTPVTGTVFANSRFKVEQILTYKVYVEEHAVLFKQTPNGNINIVCVLSS